MLLAYVGALTTSVCHYKYGDASLGGATESAFRGLLDIFESFKDDKLQKYLSRRLTAWYRMFPPGAVAADSEPENDQPDQEDRQEAGRRCSEAPEIDESDDN